MLNNTTTCRCGLEKTTKKEWCDACWESFTPQNQDAFIAAADALCAAVERCEMESEKFTEEQPCL